MTRSSRQDELRSVHRRMRRCRKCLDLGQTIVPPAIFTGGLGARILLVGQAPGIHELRAGRPFHAQSGTRLFQWLQQAGFEEEAFRAEQYMTSVTKCFPGKARTGGGDRKPSAAEVEACLPYLHAQVRLIDPELVIPVGRLAIDVFFEDRPPLEAVVGTGRTIDGRVFIPLPHPSGASRWHQLPENRKRIETAIRLLGRQRNRLGL